MESPRINLISKGVFERRAERVWRARWAVIVGSSAVLVTLGTVVLRVGSDAGLRTARADVDRMEAQRLEIAADMERMNALTGQARSAAGAAMLLADRPDWGLLLGALDAHRDDRVVMNGVELRTLGHDGSPAGPGETARVSVSISGVGRDLPSAQSFALEVERSGLFDRVSPVRTSPMTNAIEGLISFEFEADLNGDARVAGVRP